MPAMQKAYVCSPPVSLAMWGVHVMRVHVAQGLSVIQRQVWSVAKLLAVLSATRAAVVHLIEGVARGWFVPRGAVRRRPVILALLDVPVHRGIPVM